jgi:lysine 2,3-aminomutase
MPDALPPLKPATIRTPAGLVATGLAPADTRAGLEQVATRYAIAIPPALAALIEAPEDPIGRQFIPNAAELITAPHETADPIADEALSPVPGIVHRYPDRAAGLPGLLPVLLPAGTGGAGWRAADAG